MEPASAFFGPPAVQYWLLITTVIIWFGLRIAAYLIDSYLFSVGFYLFLKRLPLWLSTLLFMIFPILVLEYYIGKFLYDKRKND